ncbi:putative ABC transporter ATP-binding protein [Actinoplanes italicus]|uniref:ATP-binding cassette subfamily B protein/ATP-binding cassette subfamily C protein n=1 Tax=Actinoplanes italicus TaxID=113567 RepID=A0A2T0JY02_9ACTN|nr:ABC transporter ATP-binding protein [Actinoplanes italicus]PRX13354.1 ATP-binding cassette subfamily B protein/ATP-binding cassette subfamily C protein [Actinoplanes italicus]GIE33898.1 putative ABC transporter ATP-binding protein [Actinoplanes italicus]
MADLARWRDLSRLARGYRRSILGAAALSLLGSLLALTQPLLARVAVDGAAAGSLPWPVIGALTGLFAAQASALALARYLQAQTGETMTRDLRRTVAGHLLRVRLSVLDDGRIGDLIARACGDTAVVKTLIAQSLGTGLAGVVGLAAAIGLLAWLDPWLLAAVVVLFGGSFGALLAVVRRVRLASRTASAAEGALVADLERVLGGIRLVRACRTEGLEAERLDTSAGRVYLANLRMAGMVALSGPANDLAVSGAFLTVLLTGASRVASGAMTLGELVAFTLAMTYLAAPVYEIFQAVGAVQQGSGALHRINEVLALPVERDRTVAVATVRGAARRVAPVLEFRDVWFGYRPGRPVLRGIGFTVPSRGQVALVGPSGAGKSTIFALAERFYDPDRGSVLLHGRDARFLPYARYRASIGLVEQDSPLLAGTLRDNLLYGAGPVTSRELRRVLAMTGLLPVVAGLPSGLDTPVGEHGRHLSGGQRQRVAIARCLLARPDLILLDEPTAHLDPDSENVLAATLHEISAVCALMIIAHRFSTVRSAERVLVVDGGLVTGSGTHDELLRSSPYYRRLAAPLLRYG